MKSINCGKSIGSINWKLNTWRQYCLSCWAVVCEIVEADNVSKEDGNAIKVLRRDLTDISSFMIPQLSFLLWRTFFSLMSLTMVSGRKSWKAFSVFIFSWSSSCTFSITSLANTWGWINSILMNVWDPALNHKRWGNEPVSRSEHSWQRSRRGEWSDCNIGISNVKN